MYKKLMLALVLLTSAVWMQAQAGYPSSQTGQTPSAAGQTTVKGCLQGTNGSYTLTADNGTMYQLTGDTSKLSDHVGHEVRITGTTSESSPASSSSAATPGTAQQTLEVQSMKHISKTCKSSMAK